MHFHDEVPYSFCPLCGGANQCAPASTGRLEVECWCTKATISREALARIPSELINKACLCPRCASGAGMPDSDSSKRSD